MAATAVVATAAASLPHTAARAAGADAAVAACPGTLTWTFSSPLTEAFTASGTVAQTWGTGTTCAIAGAFASSAVQVPPPDGEFTEAVAAPYSGSATYSGSCVVATSGISSLGVAAQDGLLVGGTVVVLPPMSPSPGEEISEVDVLATASPCQEVQATGAGVDVAAFVAAGAP